MKILSMSGGVRKKKDMTTPEEKNTEIKAVYKGLTLYF